MNPIAARAEEVLRSHAHPALRISELLALLTAGVDRGLDAARLRVVLEEHPERFRVLEPWAVWPEPGGADPVAPEVWVAAIGDPEPPPHGPPALVTLRESVRWLTRGVDAGSRTEVARWHGIVLAERAFREGTVSRAA